MLKDITFKVEKQTKLAIVGVNGAGKSTLLKILCDEESFDSGEIHKSKETRLGYLSQHLTLDESLTLYDSMLNAIEPLLKKERRLRELEALMGESHDLQQVMKEYDQLTHEFQEEGGYSYQSQLTGILRGLGFPDSMWSMPLSHLSGGQKTRISLGRLLLIRPDLLLLDEPTNHLDMETIQWLESYLKSYPNAIILVSHDRYFIDQVTNQILEIENGRSTLYNATYHQYAEMKKKNRDVELKHYINNQKEIKRMQDSIDLLKSYGREKQVKRANSKEKALEKMEKVDRPNSLPSTIRIQFTPLVESGYDVLRVRNLSMSFEQPLFKDVSFDIFKQERVALLGPNGIGKTTLFKILQNQYIPSSGKIKLGTKVMPGYYDQDHSSLAMHKTIFQEISDAYPRMTNTEIRNACAMFEFKGEDVFKPIDVLSGGEKGRVVLLKLLLMQSNFLILDEPTNHLDIASKEILEEALLSFEGTIFFISHDRYFINKLASKIIQLAPTGATVYEQNYEQYMNKTEEVQTKTKNENYESQKIEQAQKRKQQNQIKKIETSISQHEEKISLLQSEMTHEDVLNDYKRYNDIVKEIETLSSELENLLETWEQLQM